MFHHRRNCPYAFKHSTRRVFLSANHQQTEQSADQRVAADNEAAKCKQRAGDGSVIVTASRE